MTIIQLILSALAVIVGGAWMFSDLLASAAGPDAWTMLAAFVLGVGLLGLAFCSDVFPAARGEDEVQT